MSIQDIANVINTLNKALVNLTQKVADDHTRLYQHDRELADIEYRLRQLEKKEHASSTPLVQVEETTP